MGGGVGLGEGTALGGGVWLGTAVGEGTSVGVGTMGVLSAFWIGVGVGVETAVSPQPIIKKNSNKIKDFADCADFFFLICAIC